MTISVIIRCKNEAANLGYHEPSLVFRTDTGTALLSAGEAARLPSTSPACSMAIVDRVDFERFTAALPGGYLGLTELGMIESIHYPKGEPRRLTFYRVAE